MVCALLRLCGGNSFGKKGIRGQLFSKLFRHALCSVRFAGGKFRRKRWTRRESVFSQEAAIVLG